MKKGKQIKGIAVAVILFVSALVFYQSSFSKIEAEESNEEVSSSVTDFDPGLMTVGDTRSNARSTNIGADYGNELTYHKWSNPNWGQEASASVVVHVYNFDQFSKALRGAFVASDGNDPVDGVAYTSKNRADYVKFMNDIENPNNTAPVLGTVIAVGGTTNATLRPDVVIDGNGYLLNTGGAYFRWHGGQVASLLENHLYIKNLDMYSQNPYGCFSIWFSRNASMVYDNVTYTGSQLSASYQSTQVYRGNNTIKSVKEYTYTNSSGTTVTRSCYFSNVASGLEGRRVYVQNGSNTTFEAVEGDALILGAYTSEVITSNTPLIHVESNSVLNVKTTGDGGESYFYNATPVNNDGMVFAGANIQNGGSVTLADNAELNIDVKGTGRAGLHLTGGSSTRRTRVEVGENSTINIETDGNMGTTASGPHGAVTATNYVKYAGISLEAYSDIVLADKGAGINVNMKNDRYQFNAVTGYSPGIRMAANSSIYVASESSLNLNMDGSYGQALKMTGANSSFLVEDEGQAKFNSSNQGTATANILQVDNGTFTIGRKGIFDMKVHDGTGVRNMFNVGSGSFTFADAYRVDLDAQANNNVELVRMAGTFNADIQAVYGWNKNNSATAKEDADYDWTPIYNAQITYAGATTTNVVANSVSTSTKNSFMSNYRTENFNRVLYEWIPDVEVEVNEVSDNETLLSGQQISGRTNPLAMVTFYITRAGSSTEEKLSNANKANEVDDWAVNPTRNYHVNADANGDYVFTLPSDVTLYVGDTIRVHSWRYGKENDGSTVVLDKTAPEVVTKDIYRVVNGTSPAASEFVSSVTDKGVNPAVWDASYNTATPQATIDNWMTAVGVYDVKLDVADRAVDADGNAAPNTNAVPWDAKLHILAADRDISADDVTTSVAVVRSFNTLDELKEFILSESNAEAFKIANDAKVDLTDQLVVSNLGSLNLSSLDGTYQVEISVPGENLTKTITVTVEKSESTVTVQFVNELDGELHAEIVLTADIGQTVDLTTTQSVLDAITDVENRSYVITDRPASEDAIAVTAAGTTVTYKFKGVLKLTSAPATVDFGSLTYNAMVQRVDNPTTDDDLVVTDTRADTTDGWTLYAELTSNMTNVSTGSIMNEALWYVDSSGNEIPLTVDYGSQAVYTSSAGGSFDITSTWGDTSNDPGLKLIADPTKTTISSVGTYSGVVTWTIMAGQP